MKSIKVNLIYNIVYQMTIVLIPFILSPYLARILGAENMGIYSYTYSLAFFCTLFVMLGIANYGNRSIAQVRENKGDTSNVFWNIYAVQVVLSCAVIVFYLFYCLFLADNYQAIIFIQIFIILASAFDVTWFFYGLEEFKVITIRNAVIKISSMLLIFTLVDSADDLWIYTLIMSGGTFLGQILIWPLLVKKIGFTLPNRADIIIHLKPILILFIPVLATSLFTWINVVLLGKMSDMVQVSFYENSAKIISIPKTLITTLGIVMMPRAANLIASGKEQESRKYIRASMFCVIFLGTACTFGVAGVANVFAPIYWGSEFADCGTLIAVLSFALIFSVFGNVIRTQYMIPKSLDRDFAVSLVMGAIINLVICLILIDEFGALGAVIGSVCAEIVLCSYQTFVARKDLDILGYLKYLYVFLPIGVFMFTVLKVIEKLMPLSFTTLLVQVFTGAIIYLTLSAIYIYKSQDEVALEVKGRVRGILKNRWKFL